MSASPITSATIELMGIAIFKNAFERWADDARAQSFAVHVGAAVAALQEATAGMVQLPSSSRRRAGVRRVPRKVRR